jgi:hypothetical protein
MISVVGVAVVSRGLRTTGISQATSPPRKATSGNPGSRRKNGHGPDCRDWLSVSSARSRGTSIGGSLGGTLGYVARNDRDCLGDFNRDVGQLIVCGVGIVHSGSEYLEFLLKFLQLFLAGRRMFLHLGDGIALDIFQALALVRGVVDASVQVGELLVIFLSDDDCLATTVAEIAILVIGRGMGGAGAAGSGTVSNLLSLLAKAGASSYLLLTRTSWGGRGNGASG